MMATSQQAAKKTTPAKKTAAKAPVKAAPKPAAGAKDHLDAADLQAKYGYTAALLNSTPELKNLFKQAYDGQWTAERFTASLRNTKWYQDHSDTWRSTEALRLQDPKTYTSNLNAYEAHVRQIAAQMGATNLPDIKAVATAFYRGGYSDEQVQAGLANRVVSQNGAMSGTAGQTEDQLKQLALANGLTLSDGWYQGAARAVASGLGSVEGYQQHIREQAASLYAPYKDQILAGQNVSDIASSYTNQMAQTLEIPPTDIKLTDPYIQKALKGVDSKGQPAVQSLWDFDQQLKQDPRWAQTKNAVDTTSTTARGVLAGMGFGV